MGKKVILVLITVIVIGTFAVLNRPKDFRNQLPPDIDPDLPFITGEIISSKEAIFDNGKGYVIEINTDVSYEDAVQFYIDEYKAEGAVLNLNPVISQEKTTSADVMIKGSEIYMEIIDKGTYTYINTAIHLKE
ncbi:MAG: hypothetical protein HGA49_08720 [Eubacteriaceae bacterium]|nr:hypothetical protein [Eubacteriaceae bacterium]